MDDPTTYEESKEEVKWVKAMEQEIKSIEQNHTWVLVEAPSGVQPIGVKWIFKTKLNEKGEVDKYKARLVVKGYSQQKGVDYEEVFAPVARWDTIRTIMSLTAQRGWKVFQLDVKRTFLYGELNELVYVEQPKGFVKAGEESKVYKLNRALYGLKQASRAWFTRLEIYFVKVGFRKSKYDHTLFIKQVGKNVVIVSVHVDDLIYTGNDKVSCDEFKASMRQEFEMADLGEMRFFLGVEVQQSSSGIHICQKKYAKEVLERFGMWDCKAVKNPIVPGTILTKTNMGTDVDASMYKRLVGSLMYLTVTRPDIAYVVSLLSRFMASPKEQHLQVAKRVLRYLKGTCDHGLLYERGGKDGLLVYTDSDYARDLEDRKCTSGYVCLLRKAAVCWSSRKQEIEALSSTEAEYVGATMCVQHRVWLKGLLEDLGYTKSDPIEVFCDNSSTIKLSKNPVMHRRTKHIDVRFHYLRELVGNGTVSLVFCGTVKQIADVMTKPMKLDVFNRFKSMLGVQKNKLEA